MKNMKKTLFTISIFACLSVGAVVLQTANKSMNKMLGSSSAEIIKKSSPKTSYLMGSSDAEYIDFMTGFSCGGINNPDLARFRNDIFWSEKMRFFGMDYFCDTSKASGGEAWTGTFTSREFSQKGNPYVCFQMGGDAEKNRNYCEIEAKVDEEWVSLGKTYNTYFQDPLSCQQLIFRVVEIPSEYRNSTLRAKFVDGATGNFGMLTFGAFAGACTLDSAAKLYNLYDLALTDALLPESSGNLVNINNAKASNHIRTDILTNAEYTAVSTRAAALGEVNNISDDFELFEGFPTFTEDYLFSNNGVDDGHFNVFTNSYRTNLEVANWADHMPFNQTGSYFLSPSMDENGSATDEKLKARFFSSPFILSGSGYISIKMAGRSAKVTVWDADTYAELFSVVDDNDAGLRIFDDKGWSVEATCKNGSRLGTMTRVYIDCTDHIGDKLFVSIEDYRTGGDWGLSRFDEFVSYYAEVPTIGYDVISQTHNDVTGYGVCRDILAHGQSNDFTSAWNFLENTYFPEARSFSNTNPASFCSGANTVDSGIKSTIKTAYDALSSGAQAIVDAARDYQYSGYGLAVEMYQTSLITTYTVGQALTYMGIK